MAAKKKQNKRIAIGGTGFEVEIDKHGNHELFQWVDEEEVTNPINKKVSVREAGYKAIGAHYGNMRDALRGAALRCAGERATTLNGCVEELNEWNRTIKKYVEGEAE